MSDAWANMARAIIGGARNSRASEHTAEVLRRGKDGTYWVKIPGGADETPISTAVVSAEAGDTVRVSIANGRSVMTGNVSSPSATTRTVSKVGAIANRAITTAYSERARIDELETSKLSASSAVITELQSETAKIEQVTAEQINSSVAFIDELGAGDVTAAAIVADHGAIAGLDVNNIKATYAAIDFANVNAANVSVEKIGELFARSGMFEDITVLGNGTVTGRLNAVLLDGDTARFSNIYADAIKILGEDGLYHALNLAGLSEQESAAMVSAYGEDLEDGLHGSRIIAESITATQIDVSSLTAAMLLAQAVQIGASGGTHIEARGDRFSFFAGGYGYSSLPDGYTPVAGTAMPGEVAYIAVDPVTQESMFYMTRSVVVKDLRFGDWMWFSRRNRNMALKWIGSD